MRLSRSPFGHIVTYADRLRSLMEMARKREVSFSIMAGTERPTISVQTRERYSAEGAPRLADRRAFSPVALMASSNSESLVESEGEQALPRGKDLLRGSDTSIPRLGAAHELPVSLGAALRAL